MGGHVCMCGGEGECGAELCAHAWGAHCIRMLAHLRAITPARFRHTRKRLAVTDLCLSLNFDYTRYKGHCQFSGKKITCTQFGKSQMMLGDQSLPASAITMPRRLIMMF